MSRKLLQQSATLLTEIADFLQNNNNPLEGKVLHALINRLKADVFHLAVIGGYNRGKSTLINALLSEEILHFDNQPATKSIVRIKQGKKHEIFFHANGNSPQKFNNINDLKTSLQKVLAEGQSHQTITVSFPSKLNKDVYLIDTPGINEQHETITQDFISQIDSAIYIFGAREQPESELRFFRSLAEEIPMFCVVNRIDEPNSEADLNRNVDYLQTIIQEFTPMLHLVSGYLGLRARQWIRNPNQFEEIRAKERKLRGFETAEEMLQESRLPEFEVELQTWLHRRRNQQLWRGTRLAQQGLKQNQAQVQQAIETARQELDLKTPQLQKQLDDTLRDKKLLELSLQDLTEQLDWLIKTAWLETGLQTLQAELDRVQQTTNNLIETVQPIELKDIFFETANNAWMTTLSQIQTVMAESANEIVTKITEKIEQDCNKIPALPNFNLEVPEKLNNPWPLPVKYKPNSKSKRTNTTTILRIWAPEEQTNVQTKILRKGINTWQNLRGMTTKLQQVFEQELEDHSNALQSIVVSVWKTWRYQILSECKAIYQPLIANLEQRQADLNMQCQTLEQNLAKCEAHAEHINQYYNKFMPALTNMEKSLNAALPIKPRGNTFTPQQFFLIGLLAILIVILIFLVFLVVGYANGYFVEVDTSTTLALLPTEWGIHLRRFS